MVAKTMNPTSTTKARTTTRPATKRKAEPIVIRLGAGKPSLAELFTDAMQRSLMGALAIHTRDWKGGRHKGSIPFVCEIDKPATLAKGRSRAARVD